MMIIWILQLLLCTDPSGQAPRADASETEALAESFERWLPLYDRDFRSTIEIRTNPLDITGRRPSEPPQVGISKHTLEYTASGARFKSRRTIDVGRGRPGDVTSDVLIWTGEEAWFWYTNPDRRHSKTVKQLVHPGDRYSFGFLFMPMDGRYPAPKTYPELIREAELVGLRHGQAESTYDFETALDGPHRHRVTIRVRTEPSFELLEVRKAWSSAAAKESFEAHEIMSVTYRVLEWAMHEGVSLPNRAQVTIQNRYDWQREHLVDWSVLDEFYECTAFEFIDPGTLDEDTFKISFQHDDLIYDERVAIGYRIGADSAQMDDLEIALDQPLVSFPGRRLRSALPRGASEPDEVVSKETDDLIAATPHEADSPLDPEPAGWSGPLGITLVILGTWFLIQVLWPPARASTAPGMAHREESS